MEIIQNSPVLEHLNLSSATTLDNVTLAKIVMENQLHNLCELALMSAPLLNLDSIELLVRNDGYFIFISREKQITRVFVLSADL